MEAPGRCHPAKIVRAARSDHSDPVHWWRHTTDATFGWREWFRPLNVAGSAPGSGFRNRERVWQRPQAGVVTLRGLVRQLKR
jgi:hypothetical protein